MPMGYQLFIAGFLGLGLLGFIVRMINIDEPLSWFGKCFFAAFALTAIGIIGYESTDPRGDYRYRTVMLECVEGVQYMHYGNHNMTSGFTITGKPCDGREPRKIKFKQAVEKD